MKKLFAAASALFGSIPGFAVMWRGIGVPPDYSLLFGGIIECLGVLALIVLLVNRKRIKKLTDRSVTKTAILLTTSAVLCLAVYLYLLQLCVVSHPTHGTIYFPLWTSGHITQIIESTGGRYAALDKYGNHSVANAVRQMPGYPMAIAFTTIILMVLYQAIFTCLTVAFGMIGLHQGKTFN
jgi:amino acid transporter